MNILICIYCVQNNSPVDHISRLNHWLLGKYTVAGSIKILHKISSRKSSMFTFLLDLWLSNAHV